MKVSIITFSRAINYGAVLQSLALKETIQSLGNECDILNYKCKEVEKGASPFYIKSFSVKDILIFLMQIKMRINKNKKFDKFARKYLDKDKELLTPKNICIVKDNYDVFVTGSDQVWNYEITGFDKNYFLDFVNGEKQCISYAASFGVDKIPDMYKDKYCKFLKNMDCISVREEKGKQIIEDLSNKTKDSIVCIDPVFLFDKSKWEQYLTNPLFDEEYILVYSINKSECYEVAKKLSQEKQIKIVGLQVPMSMRGDFKKIQTESPEEFLTWIHNAKYVITDSFHGTAFSIIFNKQFVVCTGGKTMSRASRQMNLLNLVNLGSQICSVNDYSMINNNIDYYRVNNQIDKKRQEALTYLRNSIKRKEK